MFMNCSVWKLFPLTQGRLLTFLQLRGGPCCKLAIMHLLIREKDIREAIEKLLGTCKLKGKEYLIMLTLCVALTQAWHVNKHVSLSSAVTELRHSLHWAAAVYACGQSCASLPTVVSEDRRYLRLTLALANHLSLSSTLANRKLQCLSVVFRMTQERLYSTTKYQHVCMCPNLYAISLEIS